jgi:hybrid cluster-associated redox disulfide protein
MTKQKEKLKIEKDMTIGQVVAENPLAARKLYEMGLFCGGCPMAQMETVEQGAMVHGLDPDEIVEALNEED